MSILNAGKYVVADPSYLMIADNLSSILRECKSYFEGVFTLKDGNKLITFLEPIKSGLYKANGGESLMIRSSSLIVIPLSLCDEIIVDNLLKNNKSLVLDFPVDFKSNIDNKRLTLGDFSMDLGN